jgi:thiol-disulfide isomerase/thioredoxin
MIRRAAILMILWLAGLAARAQGVKTPGVEKIRIAGLASYIAHCDHPLIVNFWATFCSPCIREIPWLQNTVTRYAGQGVELVLVSLDRPADYPARITAFARKNDVSVRILWLSETNADTMRSLVDPHWSGGLPSSLFINNATRYRRFFDRQLTESQVELAVKELVR